MKPPQTQYAKSGDVNIAYQVLGDGPIDLVHVPPFVSNLELQWEDPAQARYFKRLSAFSRLIMFDKRGTGLSDRVAIATLEQRMDDLRAVMDTAGSKRAVVFGSSEGGALAILFTATYPDRASALALYGAYPRQIYAPDYPNGLPKALCDAHLEQLECRWGRANPERLRLFHPSGADDPILQESLARWERLSASPGAAVALARMIFEIDIRHLLPAIHVPTLVVYRTADILHAQGSRYLAAHIPGAKAVELPGDIYMPYFGDQDAILDEIEEFVTGARPLEQPDRVLATVLYTDIVRSTQALTKLGDRRWREVLERHEALCDREIKRQRGRLVKSTGDGVLATFDGPARAVRCASAIRDSVKALGLEIRAGLHTGVP